VVVLYDLEELPMSKVADIVGCPLQTACSRLHAGRKQMLHALQVSDRGREPS
jgi:RNA polymerase sigma-70 factor (ECF subfamily)